MISIDDASKYELPVAPDEPAYYGDATEDAEEDRINDEIAEGLREVAAELRALVKRMLENPNHPDTIRLVSADDAWKRKHGK